MNVDEAAAGDVTGVHSALQIAPGAFGTAEVVDGSLRLKDVVRFPGNAQIVLLDLQHGRRCDRPAERELGLPRRGVGSPPAGSIRFDLT